MSVKEKDPLYQTGVKPIIRRLEPPKQKSIGALQAIANLPEYHSTYTQRSSLQVAQQGGNSRGVGPRVTASQPARTTTDPRTQPPQNRNALNKAIQTARITQQQQGYHTAQPTPRTTGAYQLPASQSPTNEPATQARQPRNQTKKRGQRWGQLCHWWDNRTVEMRAALVLLSLLVLWILGVNAFSACVANLGDPLTYSQLAHRDRTIINFRGHQVEAHAFVSQNGYLELVLVPDDVNKPTVIVGPPVYDSTPDRLMLEVQSHGTEITVNVIAPRDVVWFVASRQTSVPWTVDVATSKGGK